MSGFKNLFTVDNANASHTEQHHIESMSDWGQDNVYKVETTDVINLENINLAFDNFNLAIRDFKYEKQFISLIEENVYMSNRIYILTANPCRVYKVLDIVFDNRTPEIRKTAKFHQYVDEIDSIMNEIC
jgi:hypothetical protein